MTINIKYLSIISLQGPIISDYPQDVLAIMASNNYTAYYRIESCSETTNNYSKITNLKRFGQNTIFTKLDNSPEAQHCK